MKQSKRAAVTGKRRTGNARRLLATAAVALSLSLVAHGAAIAQGINSSPATSTSSAADLPIGAGGSQYIDIAPNGMIYFGSPPTKSSGVAWINPVNGTANFNGQMQAGTINAGTLYLSTGHVVDTSSDGALVLDAGPSSASATDAGIWLRSDKTLGDDTTYNTLMFVKSDGSVGIGTTSPEATLDVDGDVRIGTTTAACSSANVGAIQYDSNTSTFQGCNGTSWSSLGGKPTLAASSDNLSLSQGADGHTESVSATTSGTHDLCVLATVESWSNALWGQCIVSGAPGSKWTLNAANYQGTITCTAKCYDFK